MQDESGEHSSAGERLIVTAILATVAALTVVDVRGDWQSGNSAPHRDLRPDLPHAWRFGYKVW